MSVPRNPSLSAADDLFDGLPPPSAKPTSPTSASAPQPLPPPPPPPQPVHPAPALKSALKRTQPPWSDPPPLKSALKRSQPTQSSAPSAAAPSDDSAEVSEKRLRFRTAVHASETQIIEAMQKITSHIDNPSKFSKASKLALQLIQAGSVKEGTSSHFFHILEAAMSSPSACNEALLRADYHGLFTAANDVTEHFTRQQKNQFIIWTLHAVVANDLYTDDSFVFSKAVSKIKDAIAGLPPATADDDNYEAETLTSTRSHSSSLENKEGSLQVPALIPEAEVADPFGLDTLLQNNSKKSEKAREKEIAASIRKTDEEESKIFLKLKREALLKCVEIAARRYRVPWTQTAIDILAKHAFDHINRFTCKQRDAVEKLWASIKDQQIRRKQGKLVTGKLDVNAFEWLQEKYSNEKISIRHAVGGGGERKAEQWLG